MAANDHDFPINSLTGQENVMRATGILAAVSMAGASVASAADVQAPDSVLNGTRWMEIGIFDKVENIPLERMLLLQNCFIADIAFVVANGKLTKFDRAGLSGNGAPTGYVNVVEEPGENGKTLITLHSAGDGSDMPDKFVLDADGKILRIQLERGQGSAYMKCERGALAPIQPQP
jgi:hypothetical protein